MDDDEKSYEVDIIRPMKSTDHVKKYAPRYTCFMQENAVMAFTGLVIMYTKSVDKKMQLIQHPKVLSTLLKLVKDPLPAPYPGKKYKYFRNFRRNGSGALCRRGFEQSYPY